MIQQILLLVILFVVYIFLKTSGFLMYWYVPELRWGIIVMGALCYYMYQTHKHYSDNRISFFNKKSIQKKQVKQETYYFSYHYFRNKFFGSLWLNDIYGYDFSVKREGKFDFWLKTLGLNTEYQTGDTEFDNIAFIVLDNEKIRTELKNNDTLRNILLDIFILSEKSSLQNVTIQCYDGHLKLSFEKDIPKKDNPMSEETIDSLMQTFVPLLSTVKSFFPSKEGKNKSVYHEKSSLVALMFYSVIGMFFINGVSMLVLESGTISIYPKMIHPFSIVPLGLQLTSLVLVVFFVIIYLILRQSSRLIPVIKGTLLFGVIGVFLTMTVELREINFLFDSSIAKTYVTTIVNKRKSTGRHTNYTLEVRNWHDSHTVYSMQVDFRMYHEAKIGQAIMVDQKEGFLNFPWLSKIQLQN